MDSSVKSLSTNPAERRIKSRAKFGPAIAFNRESKPTQTVSPFTQTSESTQSIHSSQSDPSSLRSPQYHPQSLLQAHNSVETNKPKPSQTSQSSQLIQPLQSPQVVKTLQLTKTPQISHLPQVGTSLRSVYKPQSIQPIRASRASKSKLRSVPVQSTQPLQSTQSYYRPNTPTQPSQIKDVWLPKDLGSNRHPNRCYWLGVTPLGYYTQAPTSDRPRSRSLASPRCIVERMRPQSNTQMQIDLSVYQTRNRNYSTGGGETILDIAERLHLTSTRVDSRDQTAVVKKSQLIAKATKSMRQLFSIEYMPTLSMSGWVNSVQFELALRIYENNQVYYLDQLDAGAAKETVIIQLNNLEVWFMCICEPGSNVLGNNGMGDESWREREYGKLTRGYSGYCDPDVIKYIRPIPQDVLAYLRQLHGISK